MNATQMLIPPSEDDQRTEQQKSLWEATHERIERFLPEFLEEVLPSPPPPALPKAPPALASQQSQDAVKAS